VRPRPAGADNFLKWRRSIDEHLELRRMTWDEYAMFDWLCTKAHPRTGTLRTSWPTLGEQTGLTPNHVEKLCRALRRKRYVWYPRHRGARGDARLGGHQAVWRGQERAFSLPTCIGTDNTEVSKDALPHIHDHPCYQAGRDLCDEGTAFLDVCHRADVRRREVRRENAELFLEIQIGHQLAVLRLEDVAVREPPFIYADRREAPEVCLAGPLEIDLVIELVYRGNRSRK
jgi:hypothetical protein